MEFTLSIYFIPLFIAVFLSAFVAHHAWYHRKHPQGKAILALSLAACWWAGVNILEYGCSSLAIKEFWAALEYFGIEAIPIAWLAVILIFTDNRKWISLRNILLVSIIPALTIILMVTNSCHGLMRTHIALDTNGPFSVITKDYGPWFWVAMSYNNLLMIVSALLLIRRLGRSPKMQRGQIFLMLIVFIVPWFGNYMFIFKFGPFQRIDMTTTLLSVSGALMTFGLIRFKLMNVIPIGRNFIMEKMNDPILITDSLNRIVDFNRSCVQLFKLDNKCLTKAADDVLTPVKNFFSDINRQDNFSQKFTIGVDKEIRHYELRVNALFNDRQKFMGRVFHFRDITLQRNSEIEREKMIRDLQDALNTVDTLSGFLPICSHCKKIRDDDGYWNDLELYLSEHSNIQFTHGLCNDCLQKYYPEEYERAQLKGKNE